MKTFCLLNAPLNKNHLFTLQHCYSLELLANEIVYLVNDMKTIDRWDVKTMNFSTV
jgi:hypothetical protein